MAMGVPVRVVRTIAKKELSDSLRIPELFKNPFYHNDYARYEENGAQ